MIVRIMSKGKSFKGVATYLTHDPKAQTKDRVGWTRTLNLANDHVPSAVDEMIATAQNAELLKQEAGIRAGGRQTEDTVKHISLNWSPEEKPSQEHMIETSEAFLKHMGWQDHQTLIVNHTDRPHAHVHLAVSVIHPQTGLKLDDDFEQRRAQKWALEYEKENGRVYCEQRLMNIGEREDAPTRPAWMAFQNKQAEFERQEKSLQKNERISAPNEKSENVADYSEWKILKDIQRDERKSFFAEGKIEFKELRNSIYREVGGEFRERWSDYYEAQREGGEGEALAALKAELVAEQGKVLEVRRDEACKELRENRDERYRDLLDDQRDVRAGLRSRQEAGLNNDLFLKQAADGRLGKDVGTKFHEAAEVTAARGESSRQDDDATVFDGGMKRGGSGMKSGTDIGLNVSEGVGFGVISFLESIADGFMGATPAPKPRQQEAESAQSDPFASNDNLPKAEERSREDDERDWYKRQRSRSGD